MVFEDRVSTYPNRYLLTNASGDKSYVTLERADEPVKVGTPLNAETFNGMQEEIQIADEDYPGCFYRDAGGTKIWVNPPLVPNEPIRYPTTECYNGKCVHTSVVELELTDETTEEEFHQMFSGATVVGISAVVADDVLHAYYPVPFYHNENLYCNILVTSYQVKVQHSPNLYGTTLRVTLKYIVGE